MRRLLCATAVSGALLLLGTGCSSGDGDENPGAAPAPLASTPAAGSGPAAGASAGAALPGEADAALSGNTEAICQQAAKTGGDAARNFALDLKLLIDAESSQNKDLVVKAKQKTTR